MASPRQTLSISLPISDESRAVLLALIGAQAAGSLPAIALRQDTSEGPHTPTAAPCLVVTGTGNTAASYTVADFRALLGLGTDDTVEFGAVNANTLYAAIGIGIGNTSLIGPSPDPVTIYLPDYGGTLALEPRRWDVADATARFALAAATVPRPPKIGDMVRQGAAAPFDWFVVVDNLALSSEAGYAPFNSAGLEAPAEFTATSHSSTSVSLAWELPAETENLEGFRIYRRDGAVWTLIATVGAGATTYLASGLSPSTSYDFRVVAVGVSPASEATAATADGSLLIITQPASQSVSEDGSVSLTVEAEGDGALSYQWRKDGVDIPGATSASLTLTDVLASDAGDYRVAVTDSAETLLSEAATITVTNVIAAYRMALAIGQSNAAGTAGVPLRSTTQPHRNKSFLAGPRSSGTNLLALAPLREYLETPGSVWHGGFSGDLGETLCSGFANTMSQLDSDAHYVMACAAIGGAKVGDLLRGSTGYTLSIAQIEAAQDRLAELGKTLTDVPALLNVHGESDQAFAVAGAYAGKLFTWQAQYDEDIKALTGQTGPVRFLLTQPGNYNIKPILGAEYDTALQTLAAHRTDPDLMVLVGPRYPYFYPDGTHVTSIGHRRLGDQHAKVLSHILAGNTWRPVSPQSIVRTGTSVVVDFYVPVPPLVMDPTRVLNPGNFGFEWIDSTSSATITAVEITGPAQVTITLSGVPTGADPKLAYAVTAGSEPGWFGSARGCLRDSDPATSTAGDKLWNWCVNFADPVTTA